MRSYRDLSTALASVDILKDAGEEWRVHFHVPLHFRGDEALQSTREEISTGFFEKAMASGCEHFEIETYTFHVFPDRTQTKGHRGKYCGMNMRGRLTGCKMQ